MGSTEGIYLRGFLAQMDAFLTSLCVAVSSAIVELIPNAITMRNQIPKSYLHYDLYCNLIPNEDPNLSYFNQVPRTGAFEVSYQGNVSRLVSSPPCSSANFYFIYIVDLL